MLLEIWSATVTEKMFPALASEQSLAKDWLSEGEDKAWGNL